MVPVSVSRVFTGDGIVGVLWDLERGACVYTPPSGAAHCLEVPGRRKNLVFSIQMQLVRRNSSAVLRAKWENVNYNDGLLAAFNVS